MSVEIKKTVLSVMETNCYLVTDCETGAAAVVDPGEYCDALCNMLKDAGIKKLEYILLTHGHFDHILAVKQLQESFGGKIVIHEADEKNFTDGSFSLSAMFSPNAQMPQKADITLKGGETMMLGKSEIKVIHTPGHTLGGVCYVVDNAIFSGDTLFCGSIGRSDFPGGDMMTLIRSVMRLAALEGDYRVLPGHESETTLENERKYNPYLRIK